MKATAALLAALATAGALQAQSEEILRTAFEGRTVRLRLDMPGSSQGVDVYPGTVRPIDFPRHAGRLKDFGTAIRRGEEALVTKVKVKDDLIEFQLGGGGYGTFGDETSADVSVSDTPKTERERNLERDLERATDQEQKRRIREELDALRKAREREDARNHAAAAVARETKEANIRQRRLEGGSRFNLRYRPRVPASALAPEAVMAALAEYVDFSGSGPGAPPSREIRKGMTVEELDALLGRPDSITERLEGTLRVSTSIYRGRDRVVTAEFVEGVLIRFTITSP